MTSPIWNIFSKNFRCLRFVTLHGLKLPAIVKNFPIAIANSSDSRGQFSDYVNLLEVVNGLDLLLIPCLSHIKKSPVCKSFYFHIIRLLHCLPKIILCLLNQSAFSITARGVGKRGVEVLRIPVNRGLNKSSTLVRRSRRSFRDIVLTY